MTALRDHFPYGIVRIARVGKYFFIAALLSAAMLAGCSPDSETDTRTQNGFVSLFDGETLEGWHRNMNLPGEQVGGGWTIEDGAITGTQDPPGHGGLLVTDAEYGDFVLTLETKLDYPVDTGVFLRVGETGKSHQVTLDYRPDGSIGSIYLPWTQGMVQLNEKGMEHLEEDAWNQLKVRIEGEPSCIRVWLNGALITDFQHTEATTEGVPRRGAIGVQVHRGASFPEHNVVRFRNLRIKALPQTSGAVAATEEAGE